MKVEHGAFGCSEEADGLCLYGYLVAFPPPSSPSGSDHNMDHGAVMITMVAGQWRSRLTGSNAMNDDDA